GFRALLVFHFQASLGFPVPSTAPSKRSTRVRPKPINAINTSPDRRMRHRNRVKKTNQRTSNSKVTANVMLDCIALKLPSSSVELRRRTRFATASRRMPSGIHQRMRFNAEVKPEGGVWLSISQGG